MFDGGGVDIIGVWVGNTGRYVRDEAILELLLGNILMREYGALDGLPLWLA